MTIALVFIASLAMGQQIKKVKITDVDAYIKSSTHPLIVNFWATWCAPCVEEIPWFLETVNKYKADSVELVLVSLDFVSSYPKQIASFVTKKKWSASFYWLNETDADYFCSIIDKKWDGTIPVSLFVNNKTGYRSFFNRPVTDRQIEREVGRMTGKVK